MARVTVHYHALLREKLARESEVYDLAVAEPRVAEVLAEFVRRHAELAAIAPALGVAVNDELAGRDTRIGDGDRIDLLPPFGGG